MLGTWGKTKYRSVDDFDTHTKYMQYMYKGSKGFAARMNFWTDKQGNERILHKLHHHNVLIYKNRYYGVPDVYMSMNSFLTSKFRTVNNLKRLNALYVDLDCYKLGMTQSQVLYWLETDYFGVKIPCPTFVIDSGRGMYLIWKISEDRNALPRWKRVQEYFAEQLKELGADEQALDAARILRVPYSVNTKSNSRVKIMRFNDVRYTLYEIIREYEIPSGYGYGMSSKQKWGEATERQREYARAIATANGLELPDFNDFNATFKFIAENSSVNSSIVNNNRQPKDASKWNLANEHQGYVAKNDESNFYYENLDDFAKVNNNAYYGDSRQNNEYINKDNQPDNKSYEYKIKMTKKIQETNEKPHTTKKTNWSQRIIEGYLRDVMKVITSRKGENCCREYSLFLIRMWLCQMTGDYEEALRLTLEINSRLDKPLPDSYVRTRTQGAETKIKKGEIYRYKKETIINKLHITEEEIKTLELEYLNITKTAKESRQARNRKKYLERLEMTGEQTKGEKIASRREKIVDLLTQKKNKSEICAEINISGRTYDRDRAYIITHGLLERALNTIKEIAGTVKEVIKKAAKTAKKQAAPKIKPNIIYRDNFVVLYGHTGHLRIVEELSSCIELLE